jgi:predicted amidophosphoribosyltransferase
MFIIGVLLGPFGILIALFSQGNRKRCPHCRELIDKDATVCSHCHRDQPKPAPPRLPSVASSQSVTPTPSPTPETVAEPTMPCPLCGQDLQVSSLKQGENWCTHCLGKFVAE